MHPRTLSRLFGIAICVACVCPAQIVISQVYGGGGNVGSTLRNDFVELFNRGTAAVNIAGWTVQYASAAGTSWDRANLSGTIAPGQYYLLQLAQGSAGTANLPMPDASGGLALSATSSKVALVSNATVLTGASPSGAQIVDFVGYGDTNYAEGRSAPALTNTTAVLRHNGGCADTNDNRSDFTTGSPSPRNSQSPVAPCMNVAPSPQISSAGVTNAATFLPGAVAPGEIVTIFGTQLGPNTLVRLQLTSDGQSISKTLSGTRVLFDGVAAPILYTIAGQVSAIVPYGVNGRRTTELQVEYDGRLSNRVMLDVVPAAPGIFTLDASGRGLGAILNQDNQVNGAASPAARGSVVILYATGAGQTAPPSEDGRITTGISSQLENISVQIAGTRADVLYAGPAPGLVAGVMQVNARVPDSVPAGLQPVQITAGAVTSQPGVVIAIGGATGQAGVGPDIDARLAQLRRERAPAPLPEIASDRDPIPTDWVGVVSWNIQVGGTSPTSGAARPPMVQAALSSMFAGTYQILAAQEISNSETAEYLRSMLPGGATWKSAFIDSTDSMDNAFWYRDTVFMRDSFLLLTTDSRDSSGRVIADEARALHPPHVAQFEIGDFDFTMITLHLTFADGDTSESLREFKLILDYLDWYFNQPDHDPDVVICGDFNTPSVLSGETGRSGLTLDEVFERDPRFQVGERRFAITVHEPTSRSSAGNGGTPARNYDHCVVSADTLEELVQARRVTTSVLTDHPEDPELRLTSDHFPTVAFFKTRGPGISLDMRKRIRPN